MKNRRNNNFNLGEYAVKLVMTSKKLKLEIVFLMIRNV